MIKKAIIPPALEIGDTIGVFSSSSWGSKADLQKNVTFMTSKGYRIYIHPQTTNRKGQSAGETRGKIDAFHALVRNPEIKAIISNRGGNRALTMLDKIDYDLVAAHPKILMGYSDMTSLLNAVTQKTGLVTFHGPLFSGLSHHQDLEQMFGILTGASPKMDFSGCDILHEGKAQGRLIGGNLSILQALSGTPYQPDTDGAILFIEDAGDHLSRYDRMLTHMKLAGWFDNIHGLIIGSFTNSQDNKDRPFGFTLKEIISEHFGNTDIPIIMNAPFGHGDRLLTFPIGAETFLTAKNGNISFKINML